MNKKSKLLILVAIILLGAFAALAYGYLSHADIDVLSPRGSVAARERNLMYFTLALSSIVVIPVFILTGLIAWRYREGNSKAKYSPELDHNVTAEAIWWIVPTIIIAVLSVVTFKSSHELDPFKPIVNGTKSLVVEVVALQWKWLFIYPEQSIASVNFVQFPAGTPIEFKITSDAPMNSFWIPRLGGQIYAMSGMSTQLHLVANQPGSFRGSSANISGEGFAGMSFVAKASSQAEFDVWLADVRQDSKRLSLSSYNQLAKPSRDNPISYYSPTEAGLYDAVVMKYMRSLQLSPTAGISHIHSEDEL